VDWLVPTLGSCELAAYYLSALVVSRVFIFLPSIFLPSILFFNADAHSAEFMKAFQSATQHAECEKGSQLAGAGFAALAHSR
jgi:hypothetical protein